VELRAQLFQWLRRRLDQRLNATELHELLLLDGMRLLQARGESSLVGFDPAENSQHGSFGDAAKSFGDGVVGKNVGRETAGAVTELDDQEWAAGLGGPLGTLAEDDDAFELVARDALRRAQLKHRVSPNRHYSAGREDSSLSAGAAG